MTAIQNLGHLFDNAEVSGKQDIIRSTLKENGAFSEGKVRREKLSNLILLTTYGDVEFGGDKKGKGAKFAPFLVLVPYGLKLSNFIEDFNRIRKLKSFIETKQF